MQSTGLTPTLHGPATGKMLQSFTLETADGQKIRSQSYRQRSNLVLIFLDGRDCTRCQQLLKELAARNDDIRDQSAAILSISPEPGTGATDLPFPTVLDPSGEVAKRQGLTVPAVVIVDRFGEVWAVWNSGPNHDLPSADDVIEWLDFLEIQCPECEPPEPWGDEQ